MRRSFTYSSLILLNILALSQNAEASKPLLDDDQPAHQNHAHKGSSYAACSQSSGNDESFLFFSSQYFDSRGWFSDSTVAWLETLSHDDKVSKLSSFEPSDLLLMPIAPVTSYVSAIVSDGLESIADYLHPFQRGKNTRSHAKRGTDEISKQLSDDETIKSAPSKIKRQRVQKLESVSKALREHVEEVLPDLPPFRVSSLSSLNTLLRVSKNMSIPKVDMRAPRLQQLEKPRSFLDHLTPAQWGDEFVESLMPALSGGRFNQLNLSGNALSSSIVLKAHWDGLATLDLSGNHITQFGTLLHSKIGHLDVSSNPIYGLFDDQIPVLPNGALKALSAENTKMTNLGIGKLLSAIHLFPNLRVLKIGTSEESRFDGRVINRFLDVSHPSLEVFGLSGWSLDETALAHVLKLPKIQLIDLSNVSFAKGMLAALHKTSSSLKKVALSYAMAACDEHVADIKAAQEKGIEVIIVN
ncbi:MAG: hypothetical protein ACTHJ4_01790 [Candidatus Nucleicultricaceae bacterium]